MLFVFGRCFTRGELSSEVCRRCSSVSVVMSRLGWVEFEEDDLVHRSWSVFGIRRGARLRVRYFGSFGLEPWTSRRVSGSTYYNAKPYHDEYKAISSRAWCLVASEIYYDELTEISRRKRKRRTMTRLSGMLPPSRKWPANWNCQCARTLATSSHHDYNRAASESWRHSR